ncbi:excalibur calcium-binding domain-containing protein [Nonomuraea sp. NPDC050536]|uniref:excalibur calcium-binding domain-containing protein n=1 Tax=Nonomuraea sp. NPDC050536 TaxID=3364366 RepID=UPI0037C7FC15
MPEQPPPAEPERPRASRLTTIVLLVSLVLVVLIAGVLGTVAVLMTRSPDAPLLGGAPPQRLAVPIHFAAVKETKPAPCPGAQAALDAEQKTCYLLEDGVTVNAVQRIEPVREKDGTYSVRIAIAPAFREKVAAVIDELEPDQRQVALVLVPNTVLAAPYVTQDMDGDSVSIAGYSQQDAEALVAKLLGGASPQSSPPSSSASSPAQQPTAPATPTLSTTLSTTQPTTQPTTGSTAPVGGSRTPDPKYPSCKEVVAAGKGPYYKGMHEEYNWYPDVDHNGAACNTGDLH